MGPWGLRVSGPEGWQTLRSSISAKVMTTVLTLASPWKPPADRQFQLPIFHCDFLGARSLRRLEGAGIELSSVQLVHKFAATLSNTMIHKQFKNDKKGFGKFGPLAEGRGVSTPKVLAGPDTYAKTSEHHNLNLIHIPRPFLRN